MPGVEQRIGSTRLSPLRWAALLLLWGILGVGVAWFARSIEWAAVSTAAARADRGWLAAAVVLNLFALPFWAACWAFLAPRGRTTYPRLLEVLAVTLAAVQTFSLVAGAASAMLLLTRWAGLSRAAALSVLTMDQIVTGLVKIVVVGAAVALAPAPVWMRTAGAALTLAVLIGFAVLLAASRSEDRLRALAARQGRLSGLMTFAAAWTAHLAPLRHPGQTALATLFALLRRATEGAAALCIQKALGLPVSFELGLLIVAALALVTVIPQPPANVGLYEAAVVVVYQLAGYPAETAVAAALLQHVAFLVAAMCPGYALLILRRPWRSPS